MKKIIAGILIGALALTSVFGATKKSKKAKTTEIKLGVV